MGVSYTTQTSAPNATPENNGPPYWGQWSAQALLLGYMEQQTVYNSCNFNMGSDYGNAGSAATATGTIINSFICPSDTNAGRISGNINNYFASMGTSATRGGLAPSGLRNSTGMFAFWQSFGIQNVSDGTSNTVAFAEGLVGPALGNNRSSSRNSASITGFLDVQSTLAGAQAPGAAVTADLNACTTSGSFGANQKGLNWADGDTGYTMFHTVVPPNSKQYAFGTCKSDGGGVDYNQYTNAQSSHPGGINALFGDGSVKFIKDSVSWQVWWNLGTKSGGEVISSDSY